MEIIKKYHQLDYYTSRLLDRYFGGMKIGVFDIETLGLNPALTEVPLQPSFSPIRKVMNRSCWKPSSGNLKSMTYC